MEYITQHSFLTRLISNSGAHSLRTHQAHSLRTYQRLGAKKNKSVPIVCKKQCNYRCRMELKSGRACFRFCSIVGKVCLTSGKYNIECDSGFRGGGVRCSNSIEKSVPNIRKIQYWVRLVSVCKEASTVRCALGKYA